MFRGGKVEDSVGKQTMYYVIHGCTFTDASLYTVYLHHTHIYTHHAYHSSKYILHILHTDVCMANLEETYPVVIKQPLACDGCKGKVFWGTFCESPLS